MGKMGEVAKDGKTIVFVSHSMGMVAELCSSAIMLDKGNIVASGTTQEVIDHYLGMNSSENGHRLLLAGEEDQDIYIERVQATNLNGENTNIFPHNEPIKLSFSCVVNRWVPDSTFGFYLTDQRGRKVFSHHNDKWALAGGKSKINTTVTIPPDFLVPGNYSLSFVIGVPHIRNIDVSVDVLLINVVDVGSIYASYEGHDYGCVFANCKWVINDA
jgi:lipopolysaccharide transport system ATP-binding protein